MAELLSFAIFPPSWITVWQCWKIHEVYMVTRNLRSHFVLISFVVSKILSIESFANLAYNAYSGRQNLHFWGFLTQNKQTKGRKNQNMWQTGCSPRQPLIPILRKFGVWGGLPDVFLKFEFQDDLSINAGAVGVEICVFPLTRLIAYTTACCYRTSRD